MARLPYEELGTLTEGPELTARVVRRPGEETLYLLNRIPHGPDTQALFRDLYFYGAHRPERTEFEELFSEEQTFCVLFRYHQGSGLRERLRRRRGSAARRLTILSDALFHVYNVTRDMPLPVVCSMLYPDNILLDENDRISLRWRLEPELWEQGAVCSLWASVAELMHFLLGKEVEDTRCRTLNSIYRKCRAELYPSLPAMLHELRQAEGSLGEADPVFRLRTFFSEKKDQLRQAAKPGAAVLLMCLLIYVIMEIRGAPEAAAGAPITEIGNITYVSAQEDEPAMQVFAPVQPPKGAGRPVFTELPGPEAALDSEDYVVQSGETLESICAAAYGAEDYRAPVAAFNGLGEGPVEAGTVLRLPRKDQLAPYLAGWQEDG